MKTLTKTFARRVISALLVTIMVFSLGITSIVSTSAAEVELADTSYSNTTWGGLNCVVYFDNTIAQWSSVQLLIGRDYTYGNDSIGSTGYVFKQIKDTNIWYRQIDFSNANAFVFFEDGSEWGWTTNSFAYQLDYADNKRHSHVFDLTQYYTGNQYFTSTSNSSPISYNREWFGSTSDMNTVNQKVIACDVTSGTSIESKSVGTVKVSGIYISGVGQGNTDSATSTLGSTSSANYNVVRSSKVTLTATPAEGYNFVGWTTSSNQTTPTDTSQTKTYYSTTSNQTYYALFEKSTSLSAGTLSVTPSVITLGEQLTFKTTANLTGESGNITYQLYEDGKKVNGVEVKVASGTQASITYTPTSAGQHTYFIRASYGELEDVDTAPTTITVAENLIATLELSETGTIVEGVPFGFVIDSNAGSLGDNNPTYKLFCKSESEADFVEVTDSATIIDGVVTYTVPTAGTYQFKASVTLDDSKTTETNVVDVTVEENTPEIKLTVDHKGDVVAGTPATITATAKPNHIPYKSITYTLTSDTIQGFSMPDSTTGAFTIPANETENLSGKHTFTVNAHAEYDDYYAVDRQVTFYITFNQPTGSDNVRVYFKSSVSWGYRPNISVNGADFVEMDTYQFLSKNSTQVAEYGWFGYNLGEVQMGDKVNITIKGNRDYFYTGTYTLDLLNETKIIPDDSGDGKAIYLALDNLNVASSSGTPMENITDSNNKHWVATATHMIIANDVSADPLAALAFAYNPVAVGDANNDGKVNVRDATLIQKDLAKISELTPLGNQVSDVNFDGKLTVKDATAIQKQIAGL